ncbi:MAG: hypothetical protein WC804_06995 [Sphingomonas sp.]|uniref:hypothetical protein n=1 Tax=Sphingomonas sp. TaxID=28214 RepID=UPI0035614A0F
MLFQLVSKVDGVDGDGRDISYLVKTSTTYRRSVDAALRLLGFQPANFTKWKAGDPDRARAFTERLMNVLQGEFYQIELEDERENAQTVWNLFSQNEQAFTSNLFALATAHLEKLDALDRRKAAKQHKVVREMLAAAALSIRSNSEFTDHAPADWSNTWTTYAVGGWARGLVTRANRIAYVYGARRSGKSRLISAMQLRLQAESPGCTILHLSVRDIISAFREHRSCRQTHEAILNKLLRQLDAEHAPYQLAEFYDFDAEMVRVLSHAPDGSIYLVISDCDACLRLDDAIFQQDAIGATKHLFSFLRPMAEENGPALLNRISAILEGSRPLGDVARAYPASPLNVGTSFTLGRFSKAECAELAALAGLDREVDVDRLYDETGGHRSLIWSVLQSVVTERPGADLPDVAALPSVIRTIADLREELARQPLLEQAFAKLLARERIDLESRTRLQHAMYIVGSDPPSCQCPLLEDNLLPALAREVSA